MLRFVSKRTLILFVVVSMVAALGLLLRPTPGTALPDYASKTGQVCATCHVNPAGGGTLTARGQAFAAIGTHTTDPAGAWAQVSGAPAPAPAPAPATGGPVSASLSGASVDDSVSYSIMLINSGDKDASNIYVAGSIPEGASFSAVTATPEDSGFFGSGGGVAAWLVGAIPTKGKVGPFVYKVAKGTARDLSAAAFVHWLAPSEGTAVSAVVAPISNGERLAVEQAINDKLNKVDRSLALWDIQPGLGTVMIEYAIRFANLWFAAQAGNWDMASYQIDEMTEIQEVGETTRPARAPALKAFEDTYLKPLDAAADAKDLAAFTAAYDKAISGCNSCHTSQSGGAERPSFKFIKIQRPTAPVFPNVDWKGQ